MKLLLKAIHYVYLIKCREIFSTLPQQPLTGLKAGIAHNSLRQMSLYTLLVVLLLRQNAQHSFTVGRADIKQTLDRMQFGFPPQNSVNNHVATLEFVV